MLRFVWHFLWQRSVNSIHPSSSSLTEDRAHSRLRYRSLMVMWHSNLLQSRDIATFCISITFHHSSSFSSFYYFNSDFWYIDMHPTLARLYPFLLGSPARCAFLSYLCLYVYLGSPARSRLSRSTVALTDKALHHTIPVLLRLWTIQTLQSWL